MLLPAERSLVATDPGVPGLELLLDGDALRAWLQAEGGFDEVRRSYLRYKPGTSCVLGVRVTTSGDEAHGTVTAHSREGVAKLAKTTERAPGGSVLAVDHTRMVLATSLAADRDLPALAVLADPRRRRRLLRRVLPHGADVRTSRLTTLSHKPARRWVGLLTPRSGEPVVLRAYRSADLTQAVTAIGELGRGRPPTPELLGVDEATGLLAVQYLPGRVLDERLGRHRTGRTRLAGTGAALALLHDRRLSSLPVRDADDECTAVLAAAEHIAVLLPEDRAAVRALALRLCAGFATIPTVQTPIHGDFSLDQVVLTDAGLVALVDLDSGAIGDPAADLACAAAALAQATVSGGDPEVEARRVRALFDGYAALRALPSQDRLALHTAAMLLRRAVEPFRLCSPRWPAQVRALVARAEHALAGAGASVAGR